jgi:competence protein ComEC
MAVAGFSPSVTRSAVMYILTAAALILDREYDPLTAVSAAAVFILLWNPFAVSDIGFQLSFSATLGLILFSAGLPGFSG